MHSGTYQKEAISASDSLESHRCGNQMLLIKGRIYCGKVKAEIKWFEDYNLEEGKNKKLSHASIQNYHISRGLGK